MTATPGTQPSNHHNHDHDLDMPSLHNLHKTFSHLLSDFSKSPKSDFRILYTHPPSPSSSTSSTDPSPAPSPPQPRHKCTHLFVLDSSFNPPSRAHLGVAKAAVLDYFSVSRASDNRQQQQGKASSNLRLLLLLATANADKAPKPAEFADRLVMMVLMAGELRRRLVMEGGGAGQAVPKQKSSGGGGGGGAEEYNIPIDIAVTKKPYFMDKAKAIDEAGVYYNTATGTHTMTGPEQTHLTGFDTLTRIFDAKYYPEDLGLRALEPFLSKHRVRAMLRTGEDGKYGDRETQEGWLRGLAEREEGFEKEWLERVDVVDDEEIKDEVRGVSSTKVREGVKGEDWEGVKDLCGDGVGGWIRERGLYAEEGGGEEGREKL